MTQPKIGISRAELARRQGVDKATVLDWEKKHWLVLHEDRSVDEVSTMIRVKSLRGGRGNHATGIKPKSRAPAPAPEVTTSDEPRQSEREDIPPNIPANDDVDLEECRRRKEYWTAEKARIDALKASGQLIPLDVAAKQWADEIRSLRLRTMMVPERIVDPAIREQVRVDLVQAWAELSERPPDLKL